MKHLWSAELPESLLGSVDPWFDPETDSLYVSDGFQTSFSSLSVRRVSLRDGSHRAVLRARGQVFSICCEAGGSSLLVAAGKRLIELDRRSDRELASWNRNVPRSSSEAVLVDRTAFLMNWAGPTLGMFDLDRGTCRRKKVGSCQGLFVREGRAWVCSGKEGVLGEHGPGANRQGGRAPDPGRSAKVAPFFLTAYAPAADALFLALGDPFQASEASVTLRTRSDRLALLPLGEPSAPVELLAPRAFEALWVSEDARRIFLGCGEALLECSLGPRGLELQRALPLPTDFVPFLAVPERGLLVAANRKSERGLLRAWEL